MELLTNEKWKQYENPKICYICKEKFKDKHMLTINSIVTLRTIVILQGNKEVLHTAYVIQNMVYLNKFLLKNI